ncbi:hypothetical protein [Dysgonomonas sp. 216]|uniref:hypothetical protein n=1 Tax=Dysgonomonas sp. 216 TaxID=2302934 RepID=UPI0013D4342E|nr:hypothetical protein [Dysgonomonas sp. 216]
MALLLFSACGSDSNSDSDDDDNPTPADTIVKIPLYFEDSFYNVKADYQAVRIGEYLWMNRNFNHYLSNDRYNTPTRAQLNKVLEIYRRKVSSFQVNMDDFTKYFGLYYNRMEVEHLYGHAGSCVMFEGKDRVIVRQSTGTPGDSIRAWGLPADNDFRQLFAMCGEVTTSSIRFALSCKPYENPVAIPIPESYWFSSRNTNRYEFNLMPGGARFHTKTDWGLCFQGNEDCHDYVGSTGDFYMFYEAVRWAADNSKTVSVHDFVDCKEGKLWHWLNVRWCRKLSDKELGYKLFINAERTNILKLGLEETVPAGYSELANGYLRGFYVFYILDREHPLKTIREIVNMADEAMKDNG